MAQRRDERTIEDMIVQRLREWLKQEPQFYTTLDGTRKFGWLMQENEYRHLRYMLTFSTISPPPRRRGRTPFDVPSRRGEWQSEFEEELKKIVAANGGKQKRGDKAAALKIIADRRSVPVDTVRKRIDGS